MPSGASRRVCPKALSAEGLKYALLTRVHIVATCHLEATAVCVRSLPKPSHAQFRTWVHIGHVPAGAIFNLQPWVSKICGRPNILSNRVHIKELLISQPFILLCPSSALLCPSSRVSGQGFILDCLPCLHTAAPFSQSGSCNPTEIPIRSYQPCVMPIHVQQIMLHVRARLKAGVMFICQSTFPTRPLYET